MSAMLNHSNLEMSLLTIEEEDEDEDQSDIEEITDQVVENLVISDEENE